MSPGGPQTPGTFIISLDFELHWGMRHVKTTEQYGENLIGARRAVPALLAIFAEYNIHATWATVGFLFFSLRSDLLRALPAERPKYIDPRLSPYTEMNAIGDNENEDPFHFARSLLEQIRSHKSQEIATQTFSHYYCLEPKQNIAAFRADLDAARSAASDFGVTLKSIVFPGNQYDEAHLGICGEMGLTAFRGNPQSWLYRPRMGAEQRLFVRGARLLDSHCNLSSRHCYARPQKRDGIPLNFPASCFLRPHSLIFPSQALQERRVMNALTYAARWGLTFHLWWHPHNFGKHLKRNIGMLRRILDHFQNLREAYDMQSDNMAESALRILDCQEHAVGDERTLVIE